MFPVIPIRKRLSMPELYNTWYRVLTPQDSLWMETRNPNEALQEIKEHKDYRIQRLQQYIVSTGWSDWTRDAE